MTGAVDYLSDGERVIAVENGHPFLGQVTGVSFFSVPWLLLTILD